MFDWAKKGLSDDAGNMDEARVSAVMMVLTYIAIGIAGISRVDSANMAAMIGAWAVGGGVLASGVGGWLKLRGGN
jgi:hypothetical protein